MKKKICFEDMKVGDEMPPLVKEPVTEVQLVRYAGASGDFNPIHTVHAAGNSAGYGGVIAQGLLIMGFVGHGITQWIPNRYLRKFRVRFTGVTRPNDVITVTGKVVEKIEAKNLVVCTVEAKDQKSEVKISGFFEAVFPARDKSSS